MRALPDFDVADPGEQELFGFDFVNELAPGDFITGIASFTITLIWGTDSDYLLRLLAPPTYNGTVVSRLIGGLQPGCRYGLQATAITYLGQQKTLGAYVNGEQL